MTRTKKILAAIIVALMVVAVLPVATVAEAAALKIDEIQTEAYWQKVWAPLNEVEAEMIAAGATPAECTMAVYRAALENPDIDAGSIADLDDNGFSFTTKGMHGGYDYTLRNVPYKSNITEEALKLITEVAAVRAAAAPKTASSNGPTSSNVLLVGPWYSQDSSFTDQYKTEAQSLANNLGGTYTALTNSNAYGTAIASGHLNKGIVIYDSHGASYSSTSYMQITTSTSLTSSDYSNGWAYNGSSWWGIDGRYVKNHCGGTLSNCMVWMAMCEGMKKSGGGVTGTALLQAGAGVVYGYSQSVSFTGDYEYEAYFWNRMREGYTVAEAFAAMTSQYGNWDPAYSSSSGAAFPIVMSPVDSYPSNPDSHQTVYSDWVMFPTAAYTVTATSNNTSYGTVSVDGYTITASPKTGYYAAGYTVTSGTATVVQNGNTFTVTPSSDCTVRINFAAKTQYTISFVANGTSVGSQTAYSGDSITLPSTVSVTADGWTFSGWIAQQLTETTTKPTYYAPGASYTVTGNVTLYALYTRLEGEGGDTVYELVDSAPADWSGNYVISYGNSTSMYLLKGVSVSSNGTDIESASNCSTYAASGVSLSGTTLSNVSDSYVFTLAPSGSYYSVKSVSAGSYLGQTSSYYLGGYSTLNTTYCLWTPGYYSNYIGLYSANSSTSYPLLSFNTSYNYFWTGSVANQATNAQQIRFWKETQLGTYYYTTNPTGVEPTYYTVTFKDWDGTVLSTQQVVEGGAATAPANPSRIGYTFTGWDKTFNNITADTVVTAQYTINSYYVTIYYQYEDGTTAATTYRQSYNYGAAYSVTSPVIEGYTASQAVVSGTMGTAAVTVTVTYTANPVEPTTLPGDVNNDGVVDFADVSCLSQYMTGSYIPDAQGLLNADFNGDGDINFTDVTALYAFLIG